MTDPLRRFEELVARHQGAVCAVAYSVVRDRALSEEIAQDAFLVAWQKLPGMRPEPVLPGWVCGIARNLARNAARRRRETEMTAEPIHTSTPLDSLLDRETEILAGRALADLGDAERDVVVLYYRGDQSLAAVATALGISEAAARKRLARGRDHLRTALAPVEAALRATRPGAAFTAACVAALATRGAVASAATPVPGGYSARTGFGTFATVLPLAALAIGSAIAVGRVTASTPAASIGADRDPGGGATWSTLTRQIGPDARAALVQRIHAARTARIAATGQGAGIVAAPGTGGVAAPPKVYDFSGAGLFDVVPPPPPGPRAPGPLTKQDLRTAIRSVQPLLAECYTSAAPQLTRRDGVINLWIRLDGEPDVGTVVESARIEGDAHLAGVPELAECMRETLMSIELPPLADLGTIEIYYPLVVKPGE